MASVKLYGADSCTVTQVVRSHLRRCGVEHDFIDLEKDPAAVAKAVEQSGKPRIDAVEAAGRDLDLCGERSGDAGSSHE